MSAERQICSLLKFRRHQWRQSSGSRAAAVCRPDHISVTAEWFRLLSRLDSQETTATSYPTIQAWGRLRIAAHDHFVDRRQRGSALIVASCDF